MVPVRRRTALRAGGSALLASLGGCLSTAPGSAPDRGADDPAGSAVGGEAGLAGWPAFGHDDRNTGHDPDATGPAAAGVAWRVAAGTPTANASPALVGDRLYVGGSGDPGTFHCLDAASGERRWSFEPVGYATSAPAVADGTVYLGTWGRRVYALDARTGDVAWEADVGHRVGSSSPAVVDGTVYLGTVGDGPLVVTGETDEDAFEAAAVVALDAATGEERWRYGEFGRKENVDASPAVADGTVFVGGGEGAVVALDAATGGERWRRETGASVRASPAVAGGTVYVGVHEAGEVVALDAGDGTEVWRAGLDGRNVKASPAVADGTVFAASTRLVGCTGDCEDAPDSTGFLSALDAADGTRRWRHETAPDTRSDPAVADGVVYFGRGDGFEAVTADGESRWTVEFGRYVDSAPAVGGGRAYVGCADGHVYAVGEQ